MVERFKYWVFQKGKGCSRCCIKCEYYDICCWDVMNGNPIQEENTKTLLAVKMARGNNSKGILYRICEYITLKQAERRKHEKF